MEVVQGVVYNKLVKKNIKKLKLFRISCLYQSSAMLYKSKNENPDQFSLKEKKQRQNNLIFSSKINVVNVIKFQQTGLTCTGDHKTTYIHQSI